jgi:hypothetical protein
MEAGWKEPIFSSFNYAVLPFTGKFYKPSGIHLCMSYIFIFLHRISQFAIKLSKYLLFLPDWQTPMYMQVSVSKLCILFHCSIWFFLHHFLSFWLCSMP